MRTTLRNRGKAVAPTSATQFSLKYPKQLQLLTKSMNFMKAVL